MRQICIGGGGATPLGEQQALVNSWAEPEGGYMIWPCCRALAENAPGCQERAPAAVPPTQAPDETAVSRPQQQHSQVPRPLASAFLLPPRLTFPQIATFRSRPRALLQVLPPAVSAPARVPAAPAPAHMSTAPAPARTPAAPALTPVPAAGAAAAAVVGREAAEAGQSG